MGPLSAANVDSLHEKQGRHEEQPRRAPHPADWLGTARERIAMVPRATSSYTGVASRDSLRFALLHEPPAHPVHPLDTLRSFS